MSLTAQLKRSIRANRREIKRALPFQLFDPLARRKSFADAASALRREGVVDRRAQVAMRYVSLLQDPAVRLLPATGAP